MGKDLDQLAGVIKGVLQEVHEERPVVGAQPGPGPADSEGGIGGNRQTPAAVQQSQPQVLKPDRGNELNQEDPLRRKQQGECLFCRKNKSWQQLDYKSVYFLPYILRV